MKVTGIIAEYNPFHKGHQYQIKELRARHCPNYVVIAMSGDFLQRGAPALMDKYTRARLALMQGADLVFELPSCFATGSANNFALGGILLFATTGLVDSVCFGAESDDILRLSSLARLLSTEPSWYQEALSSYLKEGDSFPVARTKSLPEYADLLDGPNNILAIEYLKAMETLHTSMVPLPIKRSGGAYHSEDLSNPLASASAIRKKLSSVSSENADTLMQDLEAVLPQTSYEALLEYQKHSAFLWEDDFSLLLHHQLLLESDRSLLQYADVTKTLANKILKHRNAFLSFQDFCQLLKSRDMTYTRISRVLIHILLQQKKILTAPYLSGQADVLPYLRILGFSTAATPLLTRLKQQAKAPVITSPATAEPLLKKLGRSMFQGDIFASDLYRSVLTFRTKQHYPNEYQQKLLIVS